MPTSAETAFPTLIQGPAATPGEIDVPATLGASNSTPTSTATVTPVPTSVSRPTRTVAPEPMSGYVPNPYMGWQDTQPFDKRFEETVAYDRFNWDILHPAPDSFDWSPIEKLRLQSQSFSFRVRTARPPPWGEGQVMPTWLVEQGVQIVEGDSDVEGMRGTEPLYAGCLFLEAHGQFVEALRLRYDGDPDVAFIDIGSYGTYGEWDSEQYNEKSDSLDWHARRRIIDMYLGGQGTRPCLDTGGQTTEISYNYVGFQQSQLVMPFTPGFPDSLVYALNRRPNVGIRHDALGSERQQQTYRSQIGRLVEERWPQAPIVFEFSHDAYTSEGLHLAHEFVREMHASFVHDNFDGQGNNELIEEILAVIGYRLVLKEMTYTSEIGSGEILDFEMVWENAGVAPPYFKSYPLVISLTNSQGKPLLSRQLEVDMRTWMPGQSIKLSGAIALPDSFAGGTYDLRLAFIDPADHQPALELAIAGRDEQGRYVIGPVQVLP